MILDATAGNRTMYQCKDSEHIIYIDIERKLAVKPTILADNTTTPFLSAFFDTIFYDPPHGWGKGHPFYKYPDTKSFKEHWQGYGEIPRYYGWDKIRSKSGLFKHIYLAQKEFYRILKPDGLLWLKWNEATIPISRLLTAFKDWQVLLKLFIQAPSHTAGQQQTYWVCMAKKGGKVRQSTLQQVL